jgi:hypothetical protein
MTSIWIGPENGDGQIIDFGLSKNEIETRRSEVNEALNQLQALSELSTVYLTEVCESVGIDAYPLVSAVERLRNVSDATILKLEQHL